MVKSAARRSTRHVDVWRAWSRAWLVRRSPQAFAILCNTCPRAMNQLDRQATQIGRSDHVGRPAGVSDPSSRSSPKWWRVDGRPSGAPRRITTAAIACGSKAAVHVAVITTAWPEWPVIGNKINVRYGSRPRSVSRDLASTIIPCRAKTGSSPCHPFVASAHWRLLAGASWSISAGRLRHIAANAGPRSGERSGPPTVCLLRVSPAISASNLRVGVESRPAKSSSRPDPMILPCHCCATSSR